MISRALRVFLLCGVVAGIGWSSGTAAAAAPGKFTYIVVLQDRAPANGAADPGEPDVAALGGEVLHRWHNRRVVRLPEAAVRAIARHRGVKYVQRVQTESKVPPLPRVASLETTAETTAAIASDWAPPNWISGEYVYDGEGNVTRIGTAASPASDGGSDAFVYDSAGRLVSAVSSHGVTHSEQYAYDSFGNLVSTERTDGPSTATPVSIATNRLADHAYDSVGNLIAHPGQTTEYVYDAFNMIRAKGSSSGGAYYVYTAGDERIGVEENGEQRWTIRDLSGRVLREWEGNAGWWLWREDYVYRGSALAAAEREEAEGGTRHFHLDHLGTPRLITDENGAKIALHDYFAFGVEITDLRQEMQERGTDRPEPMKFTGHERDFTAGTTTNNRNQLDYMHARYYNPVWGRFLSVDPTWESANPRRPQSWNRYAYVENNPINKTDPDGRCPGCSIIGFQPPQEWAEASWGTAIVFVKDYVLPDGDTPLFEAGYGSGTNPDLERPAVLGAVVTTQSADEMLTRRTNMESAKRLADRAAAAEEKIGIHGVSASAAPPQPGDAAQARRSDVEKAFKVHNTPTKADPLHRTVELPKPVTNKVAKLFNEIFRILR